jgi:hypothetical protein
MLLTEFHVTHDDVLAYAMELGTKEHILLVARRCGFLWPPPMDIARRCTFAALERDNVKLAMSLNTSYHIKPCPVDVFMHSGSPAAIAHVQEKWPAEFTDYCRHLDESMMDYNVSTLRVILSERRRLGLDEDYEVLYVAYMAQACDAATGAVLGWLRPLAVRQFRRRLQRDRHAQPLFMTHEQRRRVRSNHLLHGGFHETLVVSNQYDHPKWNVFPECSDYRHYAYGWSGIPSLTWKEVVEAEAEDVWLYPTNEEEEEAE